MSVKTKIDIQRRVDTRQIDMLESVIVAFRKTMWCGEGEVFSGPRNNF